MAKGKASTIELTPDERGELESLARRRSTGQALALRARIVLAAAEGGPNGLIAERLRIFRGTVGKCRRSPVPASYGVGRCSVRRCCW